MNYFEFYPGDYMRDTTRLTLVEHGAYLRLLMTYYSEERPLPSDEVELFVIVSATSATEKAAVRKVADRFFPIASDGMRRNGRVDEEISKAKKRIDTARKNGSKGGRPNPAGNPSGYPLGMPAGIPAATQPDTHSGEALHVPPVKQELPATPGATAPPAEPDPIWGTGLQFLLRKGIQQGPARGFLGLLRKELQDDLTVAELMVEAERQDISDPCAWLRAAAKQRKRDSNANRTQSRRLSAAERVAKCNADAERRGAIDGEFDVVS